MKQFILSLTLFVTTASFGQKQGNIWFFGDSVGLVFSGGVPSAVAGGQVSFFPNPGPHNEGSSVISDSSGALLFYSDGASVWNKNHNLMPNGDSLLGHPSSTQSALIVPKPGSERLFYLFTTDAFIYNELKNGLRYSIIDMCLDNENGVVLSGSKNVLLLDTVAEKLAAVKHGNGIDYWVITHKYWSDAFYAFRLTSTGITDTVVSNIGSVHQDVWIPTSTSSAIGQLKVSPDGTKLAVCFSNTNPAVSELFNFDSSTGVVSNLISLPTDTLGGINLYGVEFSPDNSKLYFSAADFGLYQYDLTSGGGNADSIKNSRTLIADPVDIIFGMQLGPNGKIYVANLNKAYLAAIDNPNAGGVACNYIDSAVTLGGKLCSYSISGFVTNYDYSNPLVNCLTGTNEISDFGNYIIYPNPATQQTTLEFENSKRKNHTLTLYDTEGRLVQTISNITNNQVIIDIDDLISGLYFFQILSDRQVRFTGKLIIE